MSLVGTLVDLKVRYQLFGAFGGGGEGEGEGEGEGRGKGEYAGKEAEKEHFRVFSNSWVGHAQIVVGKLHKGISSVTVAESRLPDIRNDLKRFCYKTKTF